MSMQFHRLMTIVPLLVVLIMMIDGMPSRKRKTNKRNSKNESNQNRGKQIQSERGESSNRNEPVSEIVPTQEKERMSYAQSLVRGTSSGSSTTRERSPSNNEVTPTLSETVLDESFLKTIDRTIKETLTKKLTDFLREQDPNLRNKLLTPLLSENTRLELQKKHMTSSSNSIPRGSSASTSTEERLGLPGTSLDQRVLEAIDQAVMKSLAERFRLSYSIKNASSPESKPNIFPPQFGTLSPNVLRDPLQFGTLSPPNSFRNPPQFGTLSSKLFGKDTIRSTSPDSLRQLNKLLASNAADLRGQNVNETGKLPGGSYQQDSNKKIEHTTSSAEISSSGLQYNESVTRAIDEAVQQILSQKLETFTSQYEKQPLDNSLVIRHKFDAGPSNEGAQVLEKTPTSLGIQQMRSETNIEIQQEEETFHRKVPSELEQIKTVSEGGFSTSIAHEANEEVVKAQDLRDGTDFSVPIGMEESLYNTQQTPSDESRPSVSPISIHTDEEGETDVKSSMPSEERSAGTPPVESLTELDPATTISINNGEGVDGKSFENEEKSSAPSEEPSSRDGSISERDHPTQLPGKEVEIEEKSSTPSEESPSPSEVDQPSRLPKSVTSNEQKEVEEERPLSTPRETPSRSSSGELSTIIGTIEQREKENIAPIEISYAQVLGKGTNYFTPTDKEENLSTDNGEFFSEKDHPSTSPLSITANEEKKTVTRSPEEEEIFSAPGEILPTLELDHPSEPKSIAANVVQEIDTKQHEEVGNSSPSKTPSSESLSELDLPSVPTPIPANAAQEMDTKPHEEEEESSALSGTLLLKVPSSKLLSDLDHPSEPSIAASVAQEIDIKRPEMEGKSSLLKTLSSKSLFESDHPSGPSLMPANMMQEVDIKQHEEKANFSSITPLSESLSDFDQPSKSKTRPMPANVVQEMDIKPHKDEEKSSPSESPSSKSLSDLDHRSEPPSIAANVVQEIDIKPHEEEGKSSVPKSPSSKSLSELDHSSEPTLMPANLAQEMDTKPQEEDEKSLVLSEIPPSSKLLSKVDHSFKPTSVLANVAQEIDIKSHEEEEKSSESRKILPSKSSSPKPLSELDHPSEPTLMAANLTQEILNKEQKEEEKSLPSKIPPLKTPSSESLFEPSFIPANMAQQMDIKPHENKEESFQPQQTKTSSSTETQLLESHHIRVESSENLNEIPPKETSNNESQEKSSLVDSSIPDFKEESVKIEEDAESYPKALPIMESKITTSPHQTESGTFNLSEMFPSEPANQATTEDQPATDSKSQQNEKKLASQMSYIQALMKESKHIPRKRGFKKEISQPRSNETPKIAASVSKENEPVQSIKPAETVPNYESLKDNEGILVAPQPGESETPKIAASVSEENEPLQSIKPTEMLPTYESSKDNEGILMSPQPGESQDPLSATTRPPESVSKTETSSLQEALFSQGAREEKAPESDDNANIIPLSPLSEISTPRQMTIQPVRQESKDVMTSPDSLDQYGSAKSVLSDISFEETSSDTSLENSSENSISSQGESTPQVESEIEGQKDNIPETIERKETDSSETKESLKEASHLEMKNVKPIQHEAPRQIIHHEKPSENSISSQEESTPQVESEIEGQKDNIPETIEREADNSETKESLKEASHLEMKNVKPIQHEAPRQIIHHEKPSENSISSQEESTPQVESEIEGQKDNIPETIEREADNSETKESLKEASHLEMKNVKPIQHEAPRRIIHHERPLHTLDSDRDRQKSALKTSTSYAQALMTGLARENSNTSNPDQIPLPSLPSEALDESFLAAIDLNVKLILSLILPKVPEQRLSKNFPENYTVNQEEEIGEEDFPIEDYSSREETILPIHTQPRASEIFSDETQSTSMLVKPAREGINLLAELKRLKINPKDLGINITLFQPESVFFKCNSREEAENLRKIITESGTLIYELKGTYPCLVQILNIPFTTSKEELAWDIFLTFKELPKKILFYNRAGFRNASMLVSFSLLKKMEESPEIRIQWQPYRIITTLQVPRCHACHLLGHLSKHCGRPFGHSTEISKPCLDCMYQNERSQMAGFSSDTFKDINHRTNHYECPTKLDYRVKMLWDANY